jgi:hypothetical protein
LAKFVVNGPLRRSIVTTPAVEIAPIKCTFEPLADGSCCIALDPTRAKQTKIRFVDPNNLFALLYVMVQSLNIF